MNGRNIFSLLNHISRNEKNEDDAVENESGNNNLVYFHNLSYDASFIIKEFVNGKSLVKLSGFVKFVAKTVTECYKNNKS